MLADCYVIKLYFCSPHLLYLRWGLGTLARLSLPAGSAHTPMMRRRKKKYFFHQTWKGIKLKADGCKLQTVSLHFTARDWHFTPLVHCIHSNYLCCKLISRCELTGVVPPLGFTGMYIKSPRRNNNTSPTTNDNTVNTAAKSYWPLGLLSQGYPWDPWHLDRPVEQGIS